MTTHTHTHTHTTATWWRTACDLVGGQRAAARLLGIDQRTVRRWCAGEREGTEAAAARLRGMIQEMRA